MATPVINRGDFQTCEPPRNVTVHGATDVTPVVGGTPMPGLFPVGNASGRYRAEAVRYRVSAVIPTFNEVRNLPSILPGVSEWADEVLLVDAHSTDGTVERAHELYPPIRVLMQDGCGKGDALRKGFAAATGDIIVMLDADGSMDPAEIPAFVDALLAGADFAKGSRFLKGGGTVDMPLYRKLGNGAFVWLVRLFFDGRFTDLCYGYNAFWRDVTPRLALDADGFEIETLMNVRALRAGLVVAEVPSFEWRRMHGKGRLRTIPDGWRVLKTLVRERFGSRSPDTALEPPVSRAYAYSRAVGEGAPTS